VGNYVAAPTAPQVSIIEAAGMDDVTRLYAYTPIRGSGGADFWLSVGRPMTTIYASTRQAIVRDLLGIGGIMAVALAAIWFGGQRLILNPMRALVESTRQIATGNLDARAKLRTSSEVGELARAFDSMADALQARLNEVQHTQAELVEREQHLNLAMRAARMVAWSWLPQRDKIETTENFADIYGMPIIEYAQQGFDTLHPDDRARHAATVQQAVAAAQPYHSLFRVVRADNGKTVWIEEYAVPILDDEGELQKMVGVALDISEQHRTEEALRESEARFRLLADSAPVLIWINGLDGCEFVNRAYLEFTGYTLDEVRGMGWAETLHPQDRASYLEAYATAFAARTRFEAQTRMRQSDGEYCWMQSIGLPRFTEEGNFLGYVGSSIDITEIVRAEELLRELNLTLEQRIEERTAELARSNRELEQFAFIASHDLKAPLRGIDTLADFILEDSAHLLPDASQKHLSMIKGRIQRMEALLNDLLAYSRAGRLRYTDEWVDLALLFEETIELLAPPSGVHIQVETPLPTLIGERIPLQTVCRNLILNAIKHHHRPDEIQIRISVSEGREETAGFVQFTFADNGPGIDPRYHTRIFELLQTLEPRDRVEGSGVGLAMVKRIVEARGGKIWVESTLGAGATFCFTWPK
jgi:hypothetical protein